VQFVPDPVCWTEAPETLKVLSRQRRRWQRGLAETLWRHRKLTLNPRYGLLGMAAMPYFIVFELLGPPLALLGYIVLPIAWAMGLLSFGFLLSFLIVAVLLGQLLSISALALEEFSFRRHPRGREIYRMMGYAAIENLGYRQLTDVWRGVAFWDLLRRRRSWGDMPRRGFQTAPTDQGAP
jgi:cellulose synthase/poly-beta-1,6-N-acetylglucosamine synthase-like glycosyltransferase